MRRIIQNEVGKIPIGIIIYVIKTDRFINKKNKSKISILGSMGALSGVLGYTCGRMLIRVISFNDVLLYAMLVGVAALLSCFFMMGVYTIPEYVEPVLRKFRIHGRVDNTKNIGCEIDYKSKVNIIMLFNKGLSTCEIEKSRNISLSEDQINCITNSYLEKKGNIKKYKIGGLKGIEKYDFCITPRTRAEITEYVGLTNNYYCHKKYIKPLVDKNLLCLTIPEIPSSPKQRFYANI